MTTSPALSFEAMMARRIVFRPVGGGKVQDGKKIRAASRRRARAVAVEATAAGPPSPEAFARILLEALFAGSGSEKRSPPVIDDEPWLKLMKHEMAEGAETRPRILARRAMERLPGCAGNSLEAKLRRLVKKFREIT